MKYTFPIFLLAVLLVTVACSSQRVQNIDRGSDVTFRQGYPEVRVLAAGRFDEDDLPGVDLTIDIVKGSLVYRTFESVYTANVEIVINIYQEVNRERVMIQSRFLQRQITDTDGRVIETGNVESIFERLPLLPGRYEIVVSVKDQSSDQQTIRRSEAIIPDPEGSVTGITNVLILGKNNASENGFQPITTYFVPARYDSLKFQFQVTRPESVEPTIVNMALVTFNADIEPAREIAGIQPSQGSIAYKGIEYQRTSTVMTTTRTLEFETGNILIEYITPVLDAGNYRFEVLINNVDGTGEEVFRAREFNITTSSNFPSVRNIREFAEPLVYLMSRREYQQLMRIQDPDSMKQAIDRFWIQEMRNSNRARQVIELYYTRVEQANKQFSNFKEGWKTDMGMVFILFGPPLYVDNSLDVSVWLYSYNRNDPRETFIFTRPRVQDRFFPFQHYVLRRERYYHSVEYERIQLWRTGLILNLP